MKRQVEEMVRKDKVHPVMGKLGTTGASAIVCNRISTVSLMILAVGILVLTGCATPTGEEGDGYLSSSVMVDAAESNLNGISNINQAARATVLSAEAVKYYTIMLHEDIPVKRKQLASDALTQVRADLEVTYSGLSKSNRKVRSAVRSCRMYWDQMVRILTSQPSEAGLIALFPLSESLLIENQKLTHQLKSLNGGHSSPEAADAYRVGVLVTELASGYITASMNINKTTHVTQIAEMTSQIERILMHLQRVPGNTAEIQGLIHSISKMEWKTIRKYANEMVDGKNDDFKELIVAVFSARVVEKSERLALLYSELHI